MGIRPKIGATAIRLWYQAVGEVRIERRNDKGNNTNSSHVDVTFRLHNPAFRQLEVTRTTTHLRIAERTTKAAITSPIGHRIKLDSRWIASSSSRTIVKDSHYGYNASSDIAPAVKKHLSTQYPRSHSYAAYQ
jgi:hypothetical protein